MLENALSAVLRSISHNQLQIVVVAVYCLVFHLSSGKQLAVISSA